MIETLIEDIAPSRERLKHHPVYRGIYTIADVRSFMEMHVFAVWDFMSLVKALQRGLTCVEVPWIPTSSAAARLVNSIVRDEETDLDPNGGSISHFALYHRAMKECGADTRIIDRLLAALTQGLRIDLALGRAAVPAAAKQFVTTTFRIIDSGDMHRIAAAFAFGREDIIPAMFTELILELKRGIPGLDTLHYYLERHIALDCDDHSPMARQMVADLCGDDDERWREASQAASEALTARADLWDHLCRTQSRKLPRATSMESGVASLT